MDEWMAGWPFHSDRLHFSAVHRSSKGTITDTDDPEMPSHDHGVSQFLSFHARHPSTLTTSSHPTLGHRLAGDSMGLFAHSAH